MTEMEREDEGALVEALRQGDTAAFDAVYDAWRPRVFGFLVRLSRQRTLAEDLLDEVWLRLVAHARTLRPDTRLGAWLYTVARNLYWSHRRSSLLEESLDPSVLRLWPCPESWPSPFDLAAVTEMEGRVERALAALPAQHREVLLLVVHEGLTPAEAASVCGVTPEAMRQRLSRARTALAEEMELPRPFAAARRRYGT
jgi:RNA polymerase sigma-70 factor (ECF subfamily)